MDEYQNTQNKKKGYKPPKNHPWRKMVSNDVRNWARDKTTNTHINNWKSGGGLPPWNE